MPPRPFGDAPVDEPHDGAFVEEGEDEEATYDFIVDDDIVANLAHTAERRLGPRQRSPDEAGEMNRRLEKSVRRRSWGSRLASAGNASLDSW